MFALIASLENLANSLSGDKSGTCHGLLQELEIKLLCWKVTWYECLGWSMISDSHNPYVLQFLSVVYC